ncbi:hypothetical protein [Pseudomonas tolaasii]|uniref:hypothetical protein n=1 Tax=Pseudomonas tolaasii TaxID=29442 RepID=UPI0015A421FC|nr:hypothetical protein [Pseudomonas tolaasii]NWC38339.1 hypothetical protein [Pseudomonas tolaasii]
MAYNTGNPVEPNGSRDPRDLRDNAQIIDKLVNSSDLTWLGRLGKILKTWAGMTAEHEASQTQRAIEFQQFLQNSAYEVPVAYAAGISITRATQTVLYNGEIYRPVPSALPFVTTTFPADSAKWVSNGDNSLRQALASAAGSTMVFDGSKSVADRLVERAQATQQVASDLAALAASSPPFNVTQPLMSRSALVLNMGHGVNIIGDSISAGAYQGNIYTNGWPALLAKAVNNQFGAKNIGAIPMDSLYNPVPAYLSDQLHYVTWVGNWGARVGSTGIYDWPTGNTGSAAGDAINGKTVSSSANAAYVEIVVASMNSVVNVYYVGQPGGGKFDVSVNGVIVGELNTALATKTYNLQYPLIAADGGQGQTVIRLTKKDALPTEIQPVMRYQKIAGNPNEHFALMNVCNHSISGRQLVTMTEAAIIAATNCAALVLALGFNDSQADTDTNYYNTLLTKVDLIIKYANTFKCLVVVADFCWYAQLSAWQFEKNVEGWASANATMLVENGNLRLTTTAIDPFMVSPTLDINGATFTKVKVRLTRRAGDPGAFWDGKVFYATSGHAFSPNFFKQIPSPNIAIGQTKILEWDMTALTAGGTDWSTSTITQLRIDLDQAAGGAFDIDWISVEDANGNRYTPPMGRRRAALKRVAKETNGVYIPFPDKFYPDGTQIVDTSPAASELVSPLNLFADNAHPNFKGNEMIFSQISRALGLGITTRKQALLSDIPFPLNIPAGSKNSAGFVSSVSRTVNGVQYAVSITPAAGGSFAPGSYSIAGVRAKFGTIPTLQGSTSVLSMAAAGTANNFVSVLNDGTVNATVVSSSFIQGTFIVSEIP